MFDWMVPRPKSEKTQLDVTDEVKAAMRDQVSRAIELAHQATWDDQTDPTLGVLGSVTPRCYRTRHHTTMPLLPSFALKEHFMQADEKGVAPNEVIEFATLHSPECSLTWEGVRVLLPEGTSLYGTGENPGGLLLNEMANYQPAAHANLHDQRQTHIDPDQPANSYPRHRNAVVCWNTDATFYDESYECMYQSQPWILAVKKDGSALGVFVDSTYRTVIHVAKKEDDDSSLWVYFLSEAPRGPPPAYLLSGASPQEVLEELTSLTGRMEMPPRWALGYQQCRWSYYPDKEVQRIATTLREEKIPCDVIWMDIHYMNEYRCFTFDPQHFPDPKGLNDFLHEKGFKSVWMIDPGIKHDPEYSVFAQGTDGDHWIRKNSESKEPIVGKVWPGETVFPDFTRAETRAWWGELFKEYMETGIDGVWNDMNEIASFQTGGTIPSDSFHRADFELGEDDSHARYHNVYGMLMAKSTRDGVMKVNPDKRPFVLTRANFLGGQRYCACWTGDNTSQWKHLHFSIPMVLNLGLSGQSFAGIDIGGFFENATPELFARWMGIGALLPFARGHSCEGTDPHEPWSFGEETKDTCRRAIERRYVLLPYLYTLFHESSVKGLPVARPLFFADPADPTLRDVDNAFLLGADLLVQAVTVPQSMERSNQVFPRNSRWSLIHLLEDTKAEGEDTNLPELYQREGSILPLGELIQHTGEMAESTVLKLSVSLDEEGMASGTVYDDAGEGYGYQQDDGFVVLEFQAQRTRDGISVHSKRTLGARTPLWKHVELRFTHNSSLFFQTDSCEFVALVVES